MKAGNRNNTDYIDYIYLYIIFIYDDIIDIFIFINNIFSLLLIILSLLPLSFELHYTLHGLHITLFMPYHSHMAIDYWHTSLILRHYTHYLDDTHAIITH